METVILKIQCPDQPGIIATVSEWIFKHRGNIIRSDQYSSPEPQDNRFFMRTEFILPNTNPNIKNLENDFSAIANKLEAESSFHFRSQKLRMGILVSGKEHCLFDLLYHWYSKDFDIAIPMIISNHQHPKILADKFSIPFHYLSMDPDNKSQQENAILDLVRDTTDFLVLARYMQILSPHFLRQYGKDIINIHHSFLPSFAGGNPYYQAYQRGVKIIGATAHYVTDALDEGPIIEQMVEHVSHRDDIQTLQNKGKSMEKVTLSKAIAKHINHQILRHGNKTIVFD